MKSNSPMHERAGYWLWHASLAWGSAATEALKPLGVTPVQCFVLESIDWLSKKADQAPTQGDVARHAGLDPMMTSKVVRTLDERGLLKRRPHPGDERAYQLTLTPAGLRVAEKGTVALQKAEKSFFGANNLRPVLEKLASERVGGEQTE